MDLEMGYHMENIDNMSLLLTIQSISIIYFYFYCNILWLSTLMAQYGNIYE